jgi:hypothetical protein
MRSNASRSIDAVSAGDRRFVIDWRFGIDWRFVNDRRSIRSGASSSIHPIDAGGGAALLRKAERASRKYRGEPKLRDLSFHCEITQMFRVCRSCAEAQHRRVLAGIGSAVATSIPNHDVARTATNSTAMPCDLYQRD